MATTKPRTPTGIRKRRSRSCSAYRDAGARCNCAPTWEVSVWSARDEKKIRRSFPTQAQAKACHADASHATRRGEMRAPTSVTLREAGDAWLAGAHDGAITNRAGDPYKPSALASYRWALERRLYPDLGGAKLSAITRRDVQDLADRLRAEGLSPSSVRNTLMPLRAIFRRAVSRGELGVNPTQGIETAAVRSRRARVASPDEAVALIGALDQRDRAVWSTAMYAGLRRGELQALRCEDVDLAGGVIRVERNYDPRARQFIAPKSRAGRRRVPIVGVLRDILIEHKMTTGRSEGLVFGNDGETPFDESSLRQRAYRRWKKVGLHKIGLHESRHTAASFMIAAGVNAKAITTYMGHASIAITFDLYGHLMPGNEDEAATLLEQYLASAAEDRVRAGAAA